MLHQISFSELEANLENPYPFELIDRIKMVNTTMLVRDLAHMATIGHHIIGEKNLWKKLRKWKMIRPNSTEPYQHYLDNHVFTIHTGIYITSNGAQFSHTTKLTPKGQIEIIKKLQQEGFYDN